MNHQNTRFGILALGLSAIVLVAQANALADAPPRAALVERIIATAEAAVANPAFVSGPEWEAFKRTVRDPALQALDDDAFRKAFNEATGPLPFTHFSLHWQNPPGGAGDDEPAISLSWPRDSVALINVRMFEGDPMAFSGTMAEVIDRQPEAVILDLRGTPGGSFPTAVALSRALSRDVIDAGAFLTRAWFEKHGDYPTAEQYETIAPLEVLELDRFVETLQRDGAARLVLPAHEDPVFEGQLIVLTDGRSGSTCEPLVNRLKAGGATIIGERTAGAMLSAEHFPMDETFKLFVPVADYVTPELIRLDRNGVMPTIEVPGEQALDRALALLEETGSNG
ncbi:MAG: S41 family peptidase [Wenzhouxiangella sp.]|jgi:carboxyl-terminal processing protease|nr:S41 family peptidase [Wenzhouxiangella sp.]